MATTTTTTIYKLTTEEKKIYADTFLRVAACGFMATVEAAHLSGKYDKTKHAELYTSAIEELAEENPDVVAKLLGVMPFAYFHAGVFAAGKSLNELIEAKQKAAPAASGYADAISDGTVARTPLSKLQQLLKIGCSNVDFAKKQKPPAPPPAPNPLANDDKVLRYVFYAILALGVLLIGAMVMMVSKGGPSAPPPLAPAPLGPPAPMPQ